MWLRGKDEADAIRLGMSRLTPQIPAFLGTVKSKKAVAAKAYRRVQCTICRRHNLDQTFQVEAMWLGSSCEDRSAIRKV